MFFKKKDEEQAENVRPEETTIETGEINVPEKEANTNEEAARQALDAKFKAAAFGEIMSVLMRSPKHKGVTLKDLEWLIVPPFMLKQFSLAKAKAKEGNQPPIPVGLALWASVSDEVDQRLSDVEKPIMLQPSEWKSGDNLWLIDVVASQSVGNALINELKKSAFAGKSFKMRVANEDGTRSVKVEGA